MAQPGYASVIYRIRDYTDSTTVVIDPLVPEAIRTMAELFDKWNTVAANKCVQIWTGRCWADVLEVKKYTGTFAIKALSSLSGANFVGTMVAHSDSEDPPNVIPISTVSSGNSLKNVAASLSTDISWVHTEADAFTDASRLSYVKTTSSLSTALDMPSETEVYLIRLDSTDAVYWSNGLMVKAYRASDTLPDWVP